MRVSGHYRTPVERQALFELLVDPARLGEALPGVDAVDVAEDGRFTAVVSPPTALGVTPFRMEFTLAERVEPEQLRIAATGSTGE